MNSGTDLFRTYTQMRQPVPLGAWRIARWLLVIIALGEATLATVRPSLGLKLFWGAYVPCLPLVFLVAPGLWRNICPMASLNQIPRTLGFTRGLTLPPRVQQIAPLLSAALFLLIVPLRKVLLDHNGTGLTLLILLMLGLAFLGGMIFKGKSGWCSQFCPMLQVERFYGQSPLLVLPNSHCRPCVGCTKNCYDFNPTAAYLADLHDENSQLATNRKLFAGAMPWLIAAFFTEPYVSHLTIASLLSTYGRILLFVAAGIGVFMVIESLAPEREYWIALAHVVAAINVFYWFVTPLALAQLGLGPPPLRYPISAGVAVLSVVWLVRTLPREQAFMRVGYSAPSRAADSVLRVHNQLRAGQIEVAFTSGPKVLVKGGETILEVAEANGIHMESGCRMGMCGADPVRIVAGQENLSPVTPTERSTLEQLGSASECRMACCARIQGSVTLSLIADGREASRGEQIPVVSAPAGPTLKVPDDVRRLVIIGGGVAGITTSTELRKLYPQGEITLLEMESYDFYNRMGISRLVAEDTSIARLYLLPKDWAEQRRIRYELGTTALRVDRERREVALSNGDHISYDRLILATGAEPVFPAIPGSDMAGTFVLRTIDDAVQIQQHVRRRRARTAVIVGGGLLGLEAANAMRQIGVRVFVLDRGAWPLSRQLDQLGGALLRQLMSDLGIEVLSRTSAERLHGNSWVEAVETTDGRTLKADLCLLTAGIRPRVELAQAAGLAVKRGVVVNDQMMTTDPSIFAVGDVADYHGRVYGLWPASVEQAQVAAVNALGGTRPYRFAMPPTRLKVPGVDLLSVGEIQADEPDDHEVRVKDETSRQYRKLVLKGGKVSGGILIGRSDLADEVTAAVEESLDVSAAVEALEQGDWSVLENTTVATVAPR